MAKNLFIIRHAKSDWSFDVSDFDRPLNARGFRNAPEMAKRLAQYPLQPQRLVSSPAKRALTTAQLFAEELGMPINSIQTDERIYEAHINTLIQVINQWDNEADTVALFGHNPGLTLLANDLADELLHNLPTCAIMHIQFDGIDDWAMVSRGTGDNAWYAFPKDEE